MKRNKVVVFALALALVVVGVAPAMADWVWPGNITGLNNIIKALPYSFSEIPTAMELKESAAGVRNILQIVSEKVYVRSDVIDRIAGSSTAPRQRVPVFGTDYYSQDQVADKSILVMHSLETSTFVGKKASDLKVVKVYGEGTNDYRLYSPVYTGATLADGKFAIVNSNATTFIGESETIQSGYNYYIAFCLRNGGDYDIGRKNNGIIWGYGIFVDPVFIYTSTATVPVIGVSLSPTSVTVEPGGSTTITAAVTPSDATDQDLTWISNSPSAATVSGTTATTATVSVPSGATIGSTSTVTVSTNDGPTASCLVTVGVPVNSVSVAPQTATIGIGRTVTLIETILPATATNKNVTWSTSNATVATVSANGVVTGRGAGVATITVTTADGGKTATASITVVSVPQPVDPGFQLPSGVENPFTFVPNTVSESGLNSAAADTVEQVVAASASSSGTYLVLKDQVINNILSYHGNGMDSSVKIKMPVFKALVSSAGKTGVVMFQLPSSSLAGHKAGMVFPVKVVSTSASEARSFTFVDSPSKLGDGKFGIVTSNKTTFMGAEDIIQSGGTYYIAFAIKDGGRFDNNSADMYITDPTFVGLSTGHRSSSGGCSAGAFAPAVLLMLLPLAALLRKRG